jgi:hypothetical protein
MNRSSRWLPKLPIGCRNYARLKVVLLNKWNEFWSGWWPERVASLIAFAAIFWMLLPGFDVASFDAAGSDIKTLYASSWCFAHNLNAYSFENIGRVFAENRVVTPPSWYGHAPVYPPFTLAVLVPLTFFPMVAAVYIWAAFSALMLAGAVASLARTAGETFQANRIWRLVIVALAAASPAASFALLVSNVSMVVFALCVFAVSATQDENRSDGNRWWGAVELALALLLKPHLAVWIAFALLVMREREGRILALRGTVLAGFIALLITVWLVLNPGMAAQMPHYLAVVRAEFAGGSLDVTARDLMTPAAQITSFASFIGYWMSTGLPSRLINLALIAAVSLSLLWATRSAKVALARERYLLLGAWCALGMVATYHRTQDGMMLFLLLPWLAGLLQRSWRSGLAWCVLGILALEQVEIPADTLAWLSLHGLHEFTQFMIYRQAPLGALLLTIMLLAVALRAPFQKAAIEVRE